MIEFKKPDLKDIPKIKPFFELQNRRICDCTIGSTMMWRDYFDNQFAIQDNTLMFRSRYPDGQYVFTVPIGSNREQALDSLDEFCRETGTALSFCSVVAEDLKLLQHRWPELSFESSRDWADYLYESRDIVEFGGKKYAAQRNHIRRFERTCPDWSFRRITPDMMDELRQFYKEYVRAYSKPEETAQEEAKMVAEVLDNHDQYGFLGGALFVEGKIAGFSMGEIVRDTLFVHIEKAQIQYPGIYQKLVNCFAKEFVTDSVQYINREEDEGDLGLRKSKLSYRPITLIEKYTVNVQFSGGKP